MIYQDVYIEKSVHRKAPAVTKIYNVLMIMITIFMALNFVFVDYRVFGIPLIVMIIACYFDYTYTNGILEITKIKRKTKRQELISCEMKDLVVVARSKTEPVQPYIGRNMKTYDCLSHDPAVTYYTMIIRDPDMGNEIKVLFEPGEDLLEAMQRISPDKVHI